jgi:hypothetical protein
MGTDAKSSITTVDVPRFGLYYPYINFRSDSWLKVAALYWPKMARIVPVDYKPETRRWLARSTASSDSSLT